eukprot:scaffold212788_cov30-Tisochrysis_lutea.AAC.2
MECGPAGDSAGAGKEVRPRHSRLGRAQRDQAAPLAASLASSGVMKKSRSQSSSTLSTGCTLSGVGGRGEMSRSEEACAFEAVRGGGGGRGRSGSRAAPRSARMKRISLAWISMSAAYGGEGVAQPLSGGICSGGQSERAGQLDVGLVA